MRYLLLICLDGSPADAGTDDTNAQDDIPAIETWLAETGSRRLVGSPLAKPADAVTVRTRGGETLRTDGPYAETKEWIAGFDLIEAASMGEAIEIASRHPVAHFGMVEVRPFDTGEEQEG